jgi:hypothetical protein
VERRGEIAFDDVARKVIERILARFPCGVGFDVLSIGAPESAAAIADHNYRACRGRDTSRAYLGLDGRVVALDRERRDQVQTVARSRSTNRFECVGHKPISAEAMKFDRYAILQVRKPSLPAPITAITGSSAISTPAAPAVR